MISNVVQQWKKDKHRRELINISNARKKQNNIDAK